MQDIIKKAESRMNETVINLGNEFARINTGRANPMVLDKVRVDYYGSSMPINQISTVSVPEPRTILIQPWDGSMLKNIEREILKSDIGITPQNDGKVLRIVFPELTENTRKEIAKKISQLAEKYKISVRNIRQDSLKHIKNKKSDGATEDEIRNSEKKIQNLTDKYVLKIDELCSKKVKEVTTL